MFSCLVHADWSVSPAKRWAAHARLGDDGWIVEAVDPVGDCSAFVRSLTAMAKHEAVLAGFDFPIGVPNAYGERTGFSSFPDLLQQIGRGRWTRFGDIAREAHEISLERPFYPAGASAGLKQADLLAAHGVAALDELRRQCERQTGARRAACPLFWTLGGNQVGRAALAGWAEVVSPAQSAGARLWPFEGSLASLSERPGLVLAETYPAEAYGHIGITFRSTESKTRQADRAAKTDAILTWARRQDITLAPPVARLVQDGFGDDKAGEDRFDAFVGLAGMVEVASGWRAEGGPGELNRWEGWILGQSADQGFGQDRSPQSGSLPVGDVADRTLRSYGLEPFASVRLADNTFVIDISQPDIAAQERCIYAFAIGGEIVRIGSSKAVLAHRMRSWQRDVSRALAGLKSSTPLWEAEAWRSLLTKHGSGEVYGRQGTTVTTPVGTYCAYLDEESLLIGRHLPPLNRSKHR